MSKKNKIINRNINNINNDSKDKVLITSNEKYYSNILNLSLDKISGSNNKNNNANITNNILNKNYMTNAPKSNNINKRKNKKDSNITNNDTLLSKTWKKN